MMLAFFLGLLGQGSGYESPCTEILIEILNWTAAQFKISINPTRRKRSKSLLRSMLCEVGLSCCCTGVPCAILRSCCFAVADLWRGVRAGRRSTIGNRVCPKRVSGVRIPAAPPLLFLSVNEARRCEGMQMFHMKHRCHAERWQSG